MPTVNSAEFLAGQTNSCSWTETCSNTIDYWGPTGMIFFRHIQMAGRSFEQGGTKAAVALEGPGTAVDAGQTAVIDPSLNVTSWTKYPDLTGQYRMDTSWGHFQVAGICVISVISPRSSTVSGHETGMASM